MRLAATHPPSAPQARAVDPPDNDPDTVPVPPGPVVLSRPISRKHLPQMPLFRKRQRLFDQSNSRKNSRKRHGNVPERQRLCDQSNSRQSKATETSQRRLKRPRATETFARTLESDRDFAQVPVESDRDFRQIERPRATETFAKSSVPERQRL